MRPLPEVIRCILVTSGYDGFPASIQGPGVIRMSAERTPSRREFLKLAAAGTAGLLAAGPLTAGSRSARGQAKSCIFINLVGGPGHLDTFDPKPAAPLEFRGPFQPIQTTVPGLHLSELFPTLAQHANRFSLIRSLHHTAPPIHECGFQLLNTGHLFRGGPEWPSVGAVAAFFQRQSGENADFLVIPSLEVNTGVSVSHGFGNGLLGQRPQVRDARGVSGGPYSRFGGSEFGRNMACAALAVEEGARFVTLNMFRTVFDAHSWDCHAAGGSLRTDLADIRASVAPSFDIAFSQLLAFLDERGLLESTLVVATGEFGRTPLLNANGGRDHWAGAWTALVAGGGVPGGQVIGRTDARGVEPTDRPVTPQDLVATIFQALGVPPDATIPGPDGVPVAVYPGKPIGELF